MRNQMRRTLRLGRRLGGGTSTRGRFPLSSMGNRSTPKRAVSQSSGGRSPGWVATATPLAGVPFE
jgi:hypothetical protein